MAATQFDAGQKAVLDALDAAMDDLFGSGAESPPATVVLPALPGYAQAAKVQGQDLCGSVRSAFVVALAALLLPPAWLAPVLENSWANYGLTALAGYYKDALGWVRMKGLIKNGVGGTVVTTLPEGYWPTDPCFFAVACGQGGVVLAQILVDTDGTVNLTEPTTGIIDYLSLDQVSFRSP